MQKGKIKKLIEDRYFGFIELADGKDIFFHGSELPEGGFSAVAVGDEVEFDVEETHKGLSAVKIAHA